MEGYFFQGSPNPDFWVFLKNWGEKVLQSERIHNIQWKHLEENNWREYTLEENVYPACHGLEKKKKSIPKEEERPRLSISPSSSDISIILSLLVLTINISTYGNRHLQRQK